MLEREVVLRSVKHIFSNYIKECESDELIAATISHLLNCLLAPKEFIKRMDDGSVVYQHKSVKQKADLNLLDNIEKLDGPSAAAEAAAEEVEKQPVSKKEKKRQRQA